MPHSKKALHRYNLPFSEAAEREEATAELARRVLHYLLRARYDQGLSRPHAAAEVLRFADTLRQPRRRAGRGATNLLQQLQDLGNRVHRRLLRLPPVAPLPLSEERQGKETAE